MARIAASGISAEMIKFETLGDRANHNLVGNPMGRVRFPICHHPAVSAGIFVSTELPASSILNEFEFSDEALFRVHAS